MHFSDKKPGTTTTTKKLLFFKYLHFGEGKQWSKVLMERFVTLKMKEQNPAIKFELGRSISLWFIPSSDLL